MKYIKAKKKVDALKGLYEHLTVYILINGFMILYNTNVLRSGEIDFSGFGNYFTAIMWGIGLFFHILYVIVLFNFDSNFIDRWEEKKIKEIIDKD